MFQLRFGADDTFLILTPRWSALDGVWETSLLALLLMAPLCLVLGLYRYELLLIARRHAAGLLSLRLVTLLLLWVVIGWQPHILHLRIEEEPSRVRVAIDLSASMDVIDQQRTREEQADLDRVLMLEPKSNSLNRRQIATRILSPAGTNLLERLCAKHQVEIVGFQQARVDLSPDRLDFMPTKDTTGAMATDLNQALASSPGAATPLLGIVLFSDGRHNSGPTPRQRAEQLGIQRTPIFPVVLGIRAPPCDLAIIDVQAPSKTFKDTTASIEVHCRATSLEAQELTVELQMDGKPVRSEHRQVVDHKGTDTTHVIRFQARMEETGTHAYTIWASCKEGKEVTLDNNSAARILHVGDEKIKVLLVDGEARWEYHYLAMALARDPAIELERVLFTQPRIGAIKDEYLEKSGLAKTKLPEPRPKEKQADPLMRFDCILLGDIAPDQLPMGDRARLEEYVARRGGTLILIAGKRYLPLEFANLKDDPLARMLPITRPQLLEKEAGFTLQPTQEGTRRPFLALDPDTPASPWPELPKHYWGVIGKRKPAATTLLAPLPLEASKVPANDDVPGIFVQQPYGMGQVFYLGLDSTWRWRFRVGDTYHHRFWGQLVRWSAADKLLPAGNRFVRYGARDPAYIEGQDVDIAARLGDLLPPIQGTLRASAKLFRRVEKGGERLIAAVDLTPGPGQAQLLEARVRNLETGTYRMELDIPAYRDQIAQPPDGNAADTKDRDVFRILPRPRMEMLDLSTDWQLLQNLAEASGGKLHTVADVDEVLEHLARRVEKVAHRHESKPWQTEPMVWWLLSLLVGLLCVEWAWRKWLVLP